jgi:hypothetical protein
MKIKIKNKNKAKILAALYNNAKPQGPGFLHYNPKMMTEEDAQSLLDAGQKEFDYLQGRVMKIDLSGKILDTTLYNRDNGEGMAETILSKIE